MSGLVVWVYGVLLRLLPGDIRAEHGDEIRDTARHRIEAGGPAAFARELLDLAVTVAREWVGTATARTREVGMGTSELLGDVKVGLRGLVRRRGFTLVAVGTLAVGIGATTALYSVVDAVLWRAFPLPASGELAFVWSGPADPGNRALRNWTSYPDYRDYLERQTAFRELTAFRSPYVIVTDDGQAPARLSSARVAANFFATTGVEPILGRTFTPEEDTPGGNPVVVISHGLWQDRYGGSPDVVGRSVTVDGVPHTVVGVMPDGFDFPGGRLWLPLLPDVSEDVRSMHRLFLVGRLAERIDFDAASADVYRIADDLADAYPDSNADQGAWAEPVLDAYVGGVRTTLLTLLGATVLVLLVACANVANLFLARMADRGGEVAIRTALGAGRTRIVRQLLVEATLVALLGGAGGILLAHVALEGILASAPATVLPRASEVGLDARVMAAAGALSLGTVLLFGLAPALHLARAGLGALAREGTRPAATAGRGGRLRSLLVVGETAIAMALVVTAGLLVRSYAEVGRIDPGFDPEHLVVLPVELPTGRYPMADWRTTASFFRELRHGVEGVPGVAAAAIAYAQPLDRSWTTGFWFPGRPDPGPNQYPQANYRPVSPGYFATAGIELLRGRDFTDSDDGDAPAVVVVNRAFADQFFPGEDPVGERLLKETWWEGAPEGEWEIVGVVDDVRFRGLEQPPQPATYFPHAQRPMNEMTLLVRLADDPSAVLPGIREALWSLDRDLPADAFQAAEDIVAGATARRRYNASMFASFGLVGLALAAVGLFGVLSYSVSRRSHEIGVRLSLGASSGGVMRMVLGEGARLAAAGVLLGLGLSWVAGRLVESLLFGVGHSDPLTLLGVSAVLAVAAVAASLVPALRATRVDPARTLNQE